LGEGGRNFPGIKRKKKMRGWITKDEESWGKIISGSKKIT